VTKGSEDGRRNQGLGMDDEDLLQNFLKKTARSIDNVTVTTKRITMFKKTKPFMG
jgi:hypothetical protein